MDILTALIEADAELVDWIIHATPTTEAQKADMRLIVARRSKLDQHINEIVIERILLATKDLSQQRAKLATVVAGLKAATKSIDSAQAVAEFAVTALSAAASIVAML